ncbi:MAG: hypothetical protein J0I93_06505 [Legionella sp.]|nr:hypothetical protein [Legionella sp.]
MYEYVIRVTNSSKEPYCVTEILARLKRTPRNQSYLVKCSPPGALSDDLLKELFMQWPKHIIGLHLNSWLSPNPRNTDIDRLEMFCKWLPSNLRLLDASYTLKELPSPEVQQRFVKALPKSLEYLSIKGNGLGRHMRAAHIKNLVKTLHVSHALDLRENNFHHAEEIAGLQALSGLPAKITVLGIDTHPMLMNSIPSQVRRLGLPTFCLSPTCKPKPIIPATVSYLEFSGYLFKEMTLEHLPSYITSLSLERCNLGILTNQDIIKLVASIPKTVTWVSLRANRLFTKRTVSERDRLLESLAPFNTDGRLQLDDNGEEEWIRAALPLINGIEQQRVPNWDCAYQIATYLGAHSLTLFKKLAQRKRMFTSIAETIPLINGSQ